MSNHLEYFNNLLEDKKRKFKLAVFEAAEKLGVKPPSVKFWECPDFTGSEIAHCHYLQGIICISEFRLNSLVDSEIIETAAHEVSHMLHPDHSSNFHNTNTNTKVSMWKPRGGGVVSFSESDLKKIKIKETVYRLDKKKCNYYHSKNSHKKGILKKCSFCGMFYCTNHLMPRLVGLTNLQNTQAYLKDKTINENSHPCMSYSLSSGKKKIKSLKVL